MKSKHKGRENNMSTNNIGLLVQMRLIYLNDRYVRLNEHKDRYLEMLGNKKK